jgi:hypothetical protein
MGSRLVALLIGLAHGLAEGMGPATPGTIDA